MRREKDVHYIGSSAFKEMSNNGWYITRVEENPPLIVELTKGVTVTSCCRDWVEIEMCTGKPSLCRGYLFSIIRFVLLWCISLHDCRMTKTFEHGKSVLDRDTKNAVLGIIHERESYSLFDTIIFPYEGMLCREKNVTRKEYYAIIMSAQAAVDRIRHRRLAFDNER